MRGTGIFVGFGGGGGVVVVVAAEWGLGCAVVEGGQLPGRRGCLWRCCGRAAPQDTLLWGVVLWLLRRSRQQTARASLGEQRAHPGLDELEVRGVACESVSKPHRDADVERPLEPLSSVQREGAVQSCKSATARVHRSLTRSKRCYEAIKQHALPARAPLSVGCQIAHFQRLARDEWHLHDRRTAEKDRLTLKRMAAARRGAGDGTAARVHISAAAAVRPPMLRPRQLARATRAEG